MPKYRIQKRKQENTEGKNPVTKYLRKVLESLLLKIQSTKSSCFLEKMSYIRAQR